MDEDEDGNEDRKEYVPRPFPGQLQGTWQSTIVESATGICRLGRNSASR